ncbi:hypothetical protein GF340_02765 [Candidatus Peregrinibacteria bacterium]|nr:hypothetical protein [Candidatus Peregrinibacteria bacterium]
MALSEVTVKRLYLWGALGFIFIAIIYLLWAIFLNKGTLLIEAETPFLATIEDVKAVSCTQSPCEIKVAPGEYILKLQKAGHYEIEEFIEIPLGGALRKQYEFMYKATWTQLDESAQLNNFTDSINEKTTFTRDPETGRQTLYFTDENNEESIATSFIRTVTDYSVYPSIKQRNKILFIDRLENKHILYLIDLKEKSRNSIADYFRIHDLKWIPDSEKIIVSANTENNINPKLYLIDTATGEIIPLEIQTLAALTAPISENRIIAATSQSASGIEGRLTELSELDATPSANSDYQSTYNFVEYDLNQAAPRLLHRSNLKSINAIRLAEDEQSIYVLSEGIVYELKFDS